MLIVTFAQNGAVETLVEQVEGTRKFLSKVNHRFGLKPGVSIVTIATILF